MAFVDAALLDSKMFLRQPLKSSLSIQLLVFSSHLAWDGRQFSDVPAASASTAMSITGFGSYMFSYFFQDFLIF
jgi:hypothetical protein